MKKAVRKIFDVLAFLLTGKGKIADEGVDAGVLDYSGQGRDKYGR